MIWRTRALVDTQAIIHNLNQVKARCPGSQVMAVVKADAYGHGISNVVLALSDADYFGVTTFDDIEALVKANTKKPIVLLSGLWDRQQLDFLLEHQVSLVLHNRHQLELIKYLVVKKPLSIWIKVETGMHRLGFKREDVASVVTELNIMPHVKEICFMTHFACSDSAENQAVLSQWAVFQETTAIYDYFKSVLNSGAICHYPEMACDIIRPGLMLYGVSPDSGQVGSDFNLKPAMTLQSRILDIKSIKKGDAVGYGQTWVADKETTIATVSIGYGDGYPVNAPSGTPVLISDKIVHTIGRVSMDLLALDISDIKNINIGDVVTLWGEGLPLETIAQRTGLLAYSLLTGINKRVLVEVI